MTTVSNSSGTAAADVFSAISGAASKKADPTSVAGDLENRFLTLLMTQIKNQDPLNPLDNAQVTTQLSQLNMVNGIEKLNDSLSKLLGGYEESMAMQAAGIIGKNVMVAGNSLSLAGGQAIGAAKLEGAADAVTVSIKDGSGKVVQTQSLGAKEAGTLYFSWDGKDSTGKSLADGRYSFSVDASMGGKKISAAAQQIGTVSAVVRNTNGFVLDLGSLGTTTFKDVQQIL